MSIVLPSLQQSQQLLNLTLLDSQLLRHCEATCQKARKIVGLVASKITLNMQLLETGALLHDIGRAQVHDVTHGYVGGQILRKNNYPISIILIVERHVLGGFTPVEAEKVGLPKREFIPQTWEEKIVCVADKLGVFEWEGIHHPQHWLSEVNKRFVGLTQRYGSAEPFLVSMQRARQFTEELVNLAMTK
jgi:uncharacterized protein (TIGR00295 family)